MKCKYCNNTIVPGAKFCDCCGHVVSNEDGGFRRDIMNNREGECVVFKIGRALDNDIVISDSSISRHHATLERTGNGTWFLRDAGSKNGTTVNGQKIRQKHIDTDSRIQFGSYSISGSRLIEKTRKSHNNESVSSHSANVSKRVPVHEKQREFVTTKRKHSKFAWISVLLLVVAVVIWDGGNFKNIRTLAGNNDTTVEHATVLICCIKNGKVVSGGTGFFVTDKHIVTNKHVVNYDIDYITVYNNYLGAISVLNDMISSNYDLAILEVRKQNIKALQLGDMPERGDDVVSWGYPGFTMVGIDDIRKLDVTRTSGTISSIKALGGDYIAHGATLALGNSGGPLVSKMGNKVIGVNTAVIPDKTTNAQFNYAIPVSNLKYFLRANNINYK